MNAPQWIEQLQLRPHPEGGFYRETYRAPETVAAEALPPRFKAPRSLGTCIYYLLQAGDFSAFHRIKADEIWHWYAGGPLEIHVVDGPSYRRIALGSDGLAGETPQAIVPHGAWFAATPQPGSDYSLVGCTVSPGFDFADLEMGNPAEVFSAAPALRPWLSRFFR